MTIHDAKILTLVPGSRRGSVLVPAKRSESASTWAGRPALWIRTVAGPSIGFGHLRRCLILSRMLGDCIAPVFLCDPADCWSQVQCMAHNWSFMRFEPDEIWSNPPLPGGILIDTREKFGLPQLICNARDRGVPVASIHDLGLNPLPSDLVIDGSIVPRKGGSAHHRGAFYSGTPYMVLEPSFALLHQKKKQISEKIARVVINLGGGDSRAYFIKVLEGLSAWGHEIQVTGIPGFTNWGQEELGRRKWGPLRFSWANRNDSVEKIVFRADLAITAGGLSAFESLCLGTPLLALSYDRYQQITVATLARASACVDLGLVGLLRPSKITSALAMLEADLSTRKSLAVRGQQIVDGRGATRVSGLLRHLILSGQAKLSPMVVG